MREYKFEEQGGGITFFSSGGNIESAVERSGRKCRGIHKHSRYYLAETKFEDREWTVDVEDPQSITGYRTFKVTINRN